LCNNEGILLKLADVEPEKNVAELVVRVVSVAPPRMIKTRYGKTTQLVEVLISDEPGSSAILSLWGYGVGGDLSAGKVIKIVDGWAKEWRGKVQLSLGKSGRYEVLVDDGSIPSITDLGASTESEV
jgi:ssDNA-binding replication factor A large subunit